MKEQEKCNYLCEELQRLGYAVRCRIRLYGDEFELISNPFPTGSGYAVEGKSRRSHVVRQVRIPLSLVRTIEREFVVMEESDLAA